MELKFQADLDFQAEAMESIVGLFETQKFAGEDRWSVEENGTIPNRLDIGQDAILENLNALQRANGIPEDPRLYGMNFSVEMETGTGKTYVYLRTVLELNKRYGLRKFMIVVPSVAIREGVLKSLKITEGHFKDLYANAQYRYYEYDPRKIGRIRQFARGSFVEIMVITVDSFNRDTNIMNQARDSLHGQRPIDLVSKTRPILILDEPQNMESDLAKASLKRLSPLFTLRYSATHRDRYNLAYRLDPVDAATKGLVKRIEVSSVTESDDPNGAAVQCTDIMSGPSGVRAKITVNKKTGRGVKPSALTVKDGDDLAGRTGNPEYDGYVVSEIDYRYGFVKFSNGAKIKKGESNTDRRQIMRTQIRHAVEIHFQKYQELKRDGIKPLTLFFIDRVDNYASEDGFIRKAFEEAFDSLKPGDFRSVDAGSVHRGYFSSKKTEKSIGRDREAFDLIMKDKEKLLSFETPVQFVFSHSALREGWDNPNVFTICTLNLTESAMKKRQEIGRGMRLPVNQDGARITGGGHVLTIVANEKYEEYARKLQSEYAEHGDGVAPPDPGNRRERTTLRPKRGFKMQPEFKTLWDRVSTKTKYAVKIDSEGLVRECVARINEMTVDKIKIRITRVELDLSREGVKTRFVGEGSEDAARDRSVPDMVGHIAEETSLTRKTIVRILTRIDNLCLAFRNPQEFAASCTTIIRSTLADYLANGVEYTKIDEWYEMDLFGKVDAYKRHVVEAGKTIYDGVVCDSDVERNFARNLDGEDNVRLFVKLPRWFTVDTPIGTYNPDWAIVKDKKDELGAVKETVYLVAETKGSADPDALRGTEKRKIRCGGKHFESIGVDYRVATDVSELR